MQHQHPLRLASMAIVGALVLAACAAGTTPGPPSTSPPSASPAAVPAANGECCPCASAAPTSPASPGAPAVPVAKVTLGGQPFFVRASEEEDIRRCAGLVVAAEIVTDGLFLSAQQCWDEGAVWWEDPTAWESGELSAAADRWIEIELDGRYTLREAVVQADNNDAYLLSYRDLESATWLPLWTVPPAYSFGMATRPDPLDDAARQTLPLIVTTDAVRLEAGFGDGMYSVSEIQLFGEPAGG